MARANYILLNSVRPRTDWNAGQWQDDGIVAAYLANLYDVPSLCDQGDDEDYDTEIG